jgi:ketosteroid isomerase-like protein
MMNSAMLQITIPHLAIAHQAFAAQQKGMATGDWTNFLGLLSDDIEFCAPAPHLPNGVIYGKPAVAVWLNQSATALNWRGTLIPTEPIIWNTTTAGFECITEAQLAGEIVAHSMVIFYEIENGQVKRFREYIGQV